jgi:hypothetical protein
MPNGAAALKLLVSEPPSAACARATASAAPAGATKDKPGAAPAATEISIAVAASAEAICRAVGEFDAAGAMSPAIRELSGAALAQVCEIRLAGFDDIDCTAAGAEAKRILRQRHGAAWRAQHGTELPEAALDTLVGWVLTITGKVCADERRLLAN